MSRKFNGDARSKHGRLQVFQVFSRAKYSTGTSKTCGSRSSLPHNLTRRFSLIEIELATNNFNDDLIIGTGGFGKLYKGSIIGNGLTPAAIKRLSSNSFLGIRELKSEILIKSQLHHENLVPLIGFCEDGKEMILVYDYMANGTLHDHLHRYADHHNPALSWKQRLEICIGAARGLHYLHTGVKHTIIHRDVKTSTILLDDRWAAKVGAFGLSIVGPNIMPNSKQRPKKINTDRIVGTPEYLAPEYLWNGELSEKTDVYALGVVLCEVFCARSPKMPFDDIMDDITLEVESTEQDDIMMYGGVRSLLHGVRKCYDAGTLDKIIDPKLKGMIAPDCLAEFVRLALNCTSEDESNRMCMNEVELTLEFALELQESWEKKKNRDLNIRDDEVIEQEIGDGAEETEYSVEEVDEIVAVQIFADSESSISIEQVEDDRNVQ